MSDEKRKISNDPFEMKFRNWVLERDSENPGIVYLKIDREKKRNAFNNRMIEEFNQISDILLQDERYHKGKDEIRVLILTSISDVFFSAGADIEMFLSIPRDNPFEGGKEISIAAQRVFGKMEKMPFPVIAAIKGLCLTAGLELSMCCDLIVVADNAKVGQIETKYGITPGGGGTQRLTRLVGVLKARELIYTASIIDANEALKIGLVNHVFPLSQFDQKVRELALKIVKNSGRAVKESKFLIQEAIYRNEEGFTRENRVFGEDFASGEPERRLMAMLKKKGK